MKCVVLSSRPDMRRDIVSGLERGTGLSVSAYGDETGAALLVARHSPCLLVVDVRAGMPDLTWWLLKRDRPGLLVIGSGSGCARWAFDHGAAGFLMAPFGHDDIRRFVERAIRRLFLDRGRCPTMSEVDTVELRTARGTGTVQVGAVEWVEAARDYVLLHGENRTDVRRATLSSLVGGLEGAGFVRINRSFLVRASRIRAVSRRGRRMVVTLESDTRLSVGPMYRDHLLRTVGHPWARSSD